MALLVFVFAIMFLFCLSDLLFNVDECENLLSTLLDLRVCQAYM